MFNPNMVRDSQVSRVSDVSVYPKVEMISEGNTPADTEFLNI